MDRIAKIELLNSISNGTKSIEDLKQGFLMKDFFTLCFYGCDRKCFRK